MARTCAPIAAIDRRTYASGSRSRRASAASYDSPFGTYPFNASCAEVWSVTTSGVMWRSTSAGSTSAALPRSPIDRAVPPCAQSSILRRAVSSDSVASSR